MPIAKEKHHEDIRPEEEKNEKSNELSVGMTRVASLSFGLQSPKIRKSCTGTADINK